MPIGSYRSGDLSEDSAGDVGSCYVHPRKNLETLGYRKVFCKLFADHKEAAEQYLSFYYISRLINNLRECPQYWTLNFGLGLMSLPSESTVHRFDIPVWVSEITDIKTSLTECHALVEFSLSYPQFNFGTYAKRLQGVDLGRKTYPPEKFLERLHRYSKGKVRGTYVGFDRNSFQNWDYQAVPTIYRQGAEAWLANESIRPNRKSCRKWMPEYENMMSYQDEENLALMNVEISDEHYVDALCRGIRLPGSGWTRQR